MYDKFYEVFLPQPEVWKDIDGWEGLYQVSSYGRFRSLDREKYQKSSSGGCVLEFIKVVLNNLCWNRRFKTDVL